MNHRRGTVVAAAFAVTLLVAACAQPSAPPVREAAEPRIERPPGVEGAAVLAIDANASSLAIEVYRAGPLAKLGHNHVITAPRLYGRVWLHPQFERSAFEVHVPVTELIVDDEQARASAGADFPPGVPEDAKQGTRSNLLGPDVLDAAHHPEVVIRSVAIRGTPPRFEVVAAFTLRSQTREFPIPVTAAIESGRTRVQGEFTLRQTDFGLTPFSVALGALTVEDDLQIRFDLVAIAETAR